MIASDTTSWGGDDRVSGAGYGDLFDRCVLGVQPFDVLHEGCQEFAEGHRRPALPAVQIMDGGDGAHLPDGLVEHCALGTGGAGVAMKQGGEPLQTVLDAVVSFPQQGVPVELLGNAVPGGDVGNHSGNARLSLAVGPWAGMNP